LTAAYELTKLGTHSVIFERDGVVGGIARTVCHDGYRFDVGGHRFFTKVKIVQSIWEEILGEDFLRRPRLSRIYYNDHFFDYPLKPLNALKGLGPFESARIALSYARVALFPSSEERTFEQWVSNRFGRRLYEIFFKTYTEKVWGIPCSEIGAEWAAQRIKNLDLVAALKNALLGTGQKDGRAIATLIDEFHYPRLGPGMMWERCRDLLAARGVATHLRRRVTRVHHENGRITGVTVRDAAGIERRESGAHVISSMPIRSLLRAFDPTPPADVLAAAESLRYRDFLVVALIVDRAEVFPDNWIYIHSPKVRLGRIQNFKNWSPEMVPDPSKTSLGLEYFTQEDDDLWRASDAELIELGTRECAELRLIRPKEVLDGAVIRMPKAYPVYDGGYQQALRTIRAYVERFPNLHLVGRNGQHRYNNQDHSMVTAIYAARRIHGQSYDIWNVNVEAVYHETTAHREHPVDERLVPAHMEKSVTAAAIRKAFSRYDPIALGTAVATVVSLGLVAATATLILKGREPVGPILSLLGHYFLGYSVTWTGLLIGLVSTSIGGFAFGYILATFINILVLWQEKAFRRKLEMMRALE
jgi:protoporphyrinogen oxidase